MLRLHRSYLLAAFALLLTCDHGRSRTKSQHIVTRHDFRPFRSGDSERTGFAGQQRKRLHPEPAPPTRRRVSVSAAASGQLHRQQSQAAGFAAQSQADRAADQPAGHAQLFCWQWNRRRPTINVSGADARAELHRRHHGKCLRRRDHSGATGGRVTFPTCSACSRAFCISACTTTRVTTAAVAAAAGARSDQNNSTLDGLDNNDQVRGYAFTGVLRSTLDSVAGVSRHHRRLQCRYRPLFGSADQHSHQERHQRVSRQRLRSYPRSDHSGE